MQSHRSNRELWLAFIAIIGITIAYIFIVTWLNEIPKSSNLFGHAIGIIGFILMLMTETLYSLRKRSRSARWGRMSNWLNFHIFTGLVGPYLVLLHTSWKFNGLAGIVMLLTVIIVASGFIGRYIYTAVPRTADGVEIEAYALEAQISNLDSELQSWLASNPDPMTQYLVQQFSTSPEMPDNQSTLVFTRPFIEWRYRINWWSQKSRLEATTRAQVEQMENLLKRRRTLHRQRASLATARRLMALWHTIHIPIGMALFTAAIIHIIAAIYYATLLR
ncbi:MAG: hypothetical protein PVF74_01495 [Anaerolineales bacterium]|jgi:hypothetical protein